MDRAEKESPEYGETGDKGMLMYYEGTVVLAQYYKSYPKPSTWNPGMMSVQGFSPNDGKRLWRKMSGTWSWMWNGTNIFGAKELVWMHGTPSTINEIELKNSTGKKDGKGKKKKKKGAVTLIDNCDFKAYYMLGVDPQTGDIKKKLSMRKIYEGKHHQRCHRNRATENFILTGRYGIELLNLDTGEISVNPWIRGMCLYGFLPANGLLYFPPQSCNCNTMLQLNGLYTLAPKRTDIPKISEIFIKGEAWGETLGKKTSDNSWPMYRQNVLRSGMINTEISPELTKNWSSKIGKEITAPVIANGLIYVADKMTHSVSAIKETDGKLAWEFTSNGPIDSPPTIYHNFLLFGSADGFVYCLRTTDGKLIWKRQLAPEDRNILAFGRLESTHPVRGAVTVFNDILYACAGRSSYLDSGLYMYSLEPATGKIIAKTNIATESKIQTSHSGYQGISEEILVSDGEKLYMRHTEFNPKTLEYKYNQWSKNGASLMSKLKIPYLKCSADFLDESFFGRTKWEISKDNNMQILIFDKENTYGTRTPRVHNKSKSYFDPNGKNVEILAIPRNSNNPLWKTPLPFRPSAIAGTNDYIIIAGSAWSIVEGDTFANIEGRKDNLLYVLSKIDGKNYLSVNWMPHLYGMEWQFQGTRFIFRLKMEIYYL